MTPAHHMIHVRDLPRAVDFYIAALGAKVADRHLYPGARLVYLRWADAAFELELVCPEAWSHADAPEAGRVHLAFTVDDLDREHARISALGLGPEAIQDYRANDRHQTRYFYLNDPEGNQIEVLEARGRYAMNGRDIMQNGIRAIVGPGFAADAANSRTPDAPFYFDPEVYSAELRQIFGRNWLYFCHQSEIPAEGDFRSGHVGDESVFVIRGRDGAIRGFFNVCQHRAHQLLAGAGQVKTVIKCPYHSWTYNLDGSLRGAPKCEAVAGFSRDSVHLQPVAVDVIGGFVFVNLDATAEPLSTSTPHFVEKLLAMCPEASQLRLVKRQDFQIKANWKVVVENFLENYHSFYSGPAHGQLSDVIDQDSYRWSIEGKVIEFLGRGGSAEKLPYALHGARKFSGRSDGFQIVFLWPNMAFILIPGASMLLVFLMNPDGPEATSEPLLYFGLDEVLDAGTESAVDWFNTVLGPEDVDLVESVQRGLHSRGYRHGRLMVDPQQSEAWSEHFLHHFNTLNITALEAEG